MAMFKNIGGMTMDHLEEIIRNYLRTEEPYALQIDGDWGVGKTYYMKNNIEKELRSDLNHVVYFSVYGFDSLNQIKKELLYKILLELYPEKKILTGISKANKHIGKIVDAMGDSKLKTISSVTDVILDVLNEITNSVNNLRMYPERYLIIFIDDLERISSKIKVEDFIGFVGTELLEKIGCKVIFLSNSGEMKNTKKFQKIKEKTIYRTVQFKYDIDEIKAKLLKNSRIEFIKNNHDWVASILKEFHSEQGTALNIRIFKSVLENYSIVETLLLPDIKKYVPNELHDKIKKSIFLNVYVVTNEYKKNGLSERDIFSLQNIRIRTAGGAILVEGSEQAVKNIYSKYHEKHIPMFDEYIFYSTDISLFILRGYLENRNCIQTWLDIFNLDENDYRSSLSKLYEFRRYTDDQLKEVQEEILSDIKSGVYDFDNLLDALGQFDQYKDMGLIFLDEDYEAVIETQMMEEYPKIIQKEQMDFDTMISVIHQVRIKKNHKKIYENLKALDSKLRKEKLEKFVTTLFTKTYNEVFILLNDPSIQLKELLRLMLDLNSIEKYIVVPNNLSDNLWELIRAGKLDHTEKNDIVDFLDNLKMTKENKSLGKIDTFKLEQLIKEFEDRFTLVKEK